MIDLDLGLLGLYVATVIAMIVLPGPVALLVVGAGISGGAKRALATIAGTNLASLLLIALSALTVMGVLAVNETAFNLIALGGALYIVHVGWALASTSTVAGKAPASEAGGFFKGLVVAMSNPKDLVFFASFFPQFIGVTSDQGTSLLVLTLLWVALDFAMLMLLCQFFRTLLRPHLQQLLLKASGLLLLCIGVIGVWHGTKSLLWPA